MTASTADAARLREQVLALLASNERPMSEHEVLATLGPNSISALHDLSREGVIEQDAYRNYRTTEQAADALVAAMEADMQADVDAITAAFAREVDADTAVALLASQMYALDPASAQEQMAPHIDRFRRRIADAQRYESGRYEDGFGRARRSRLAALDALTAAVNIVDPGATRNDVLRRVVRSASPAALTAALTTGAIVAAVRSVPNAHPCCGSNDCEDCR